MKDPFSTVYTLFSFCLVVCTAEFLSLNGLWSVSNGKNVTNITGDVPGGIYTALMKHRIIGDPYYRYNDRNYKWIGEMDWSYQRTFNVTSSMLAASSVVLVCDGLDTVSTLKINGQIIGMSDNMFIRYVFDIKSFLKTGTNWIQIRFLSAVNYARKQSQACPYRVPPESVAPTQHGQPHCNMIRKEQCSFSWDWAPSFPSQGVWKDIYVQSYSSAVLREITSETINNKNGTWTLIVEAFTEVTPNVRVQGTMSVLLSNTSVKASKSNTLTTMTSKVRFEILVPASEKIKMWWPNGYGNQSLYDLQVTFTDTQGQMDSKKIRIGFRTVELVQDYASANKSIGRLFYFRINSRPIFFKGTNWIPADSFLERVTKDRLYNYLKSAADVHMNAMRVWGGGSMVSGSQACCVDESLRTRHSFIMASKKQGKSQEQIIAGFQDLRQQQRQINAKVSDIEMDMKEHELVIETLKEVDESRRCYRLVGGVLVERTVKDVLPALINNKTQMGKVVETLNKQLENKRVEINQYRESHNLKIKGEDSKEPEKQETEAKSGGVLVAKDG